MNEQRNINKPKTLADLDSGVDSTARTYPALIGENLGHTTLKFSMPISQFINISAVGNRKNIDENEIFSGEFHAQRNLIRDHAVGLAKYTLMGLVRAEIKSRLLKNPEIDKEILAIKEGLGDPAYASLQPIVCNIRNCEPGGADIPIADIGDDFRTTTGIYNVTLSQKHLLWVVDGQHRREGFEMVLEFLKKVTNTYKYPEKGLYKPESYNKGSLISEKISDFWMSIKEIATGRSTIAIECHVGLNDKEEQQLFFDLNSKTRKVVQSLAFQYDHTDPINGYVANSLIEDGILSFKPTDRDVTDWRQDDGSLARKDINNVTCLLCLGKSNSKGSTPALIKSRTSIMDHFWKTIMDMPHFGENNAKSNTLLAQPVVLKALAKLCYDLYFGHTSIQNIEHYKKLITSLKNNDINFSHNEEMWTGLFIETNEERAQKFPGMEKYVFVPNETNLDAGIHDKTNNWIRFGNRHNDIFPRLGDIIRWKLNLDPRPSVTKAIKEHSEEKSDG
jgi:hypothetical protein